MKLYRNFLYITFLIFLFITSYITFEMFFYCQDIKTYQNYADECLQSNDKPYPVSYVCPKNNPQCKDIDNSNQPDSSLCSE